MTTQPQPQMHEVVSDLVTYARRRGLQPADAHDTAQEAATRLLEQPAGTAEPRAWAFRVASNLISDRHRGRNRAEQLALATGPLLVDVPDPAEAHAYSENLLLAATALNGIEARYGEVIRRLDLEGGDPKQVAHALGVTPATLRQLHSRARKALRKEYLRIGGSAAGLAVLFPALRSAHRLRNVAAGALMPTLVAAAVSGPLVLPYITAAPTVTAPEVRTSLTAPGRAAASTTAAVHVAATGTTSTTATATKRAVAPRATPAPTRGLIRSCRAADNPAGICHGDPGYRSNMDAFGIDGPVQVCSPTSLAPFCTTGIVVEQTFVDTTPACQPLAALPYVVCRHGY